MSPLVSTPFRQRNPVTIGAISIVVLLALIVVAFEAGNLPLIGGGDTYHAEFKELGGLKANDEVRIAGVRVGKVTGIELKGNKVDVSFKVKTPSKFGDQTEANIKVKTLLGAMYLSLAPKGSGQLSKDSTIPVSRTTSPYDVVQAFSGPGRPRREDQRHPAGRLAGHAGDADQGHPGGLPGHPARAVPALGNRGQPQPADR